MKLGIRDRGVTGLLTWDMDIDSTVRYVTIGDGRAEGR